MKKYLFKLVSSILCLLILLSAFFSFNVFAADTVIGFDSPATVGDTVKVTVSITGTEMTGADLTVTYNADILKYVSGADSGGAGTLRILDQDMNMLQKENYVLTFSALKAGSSTISVSGYKSDGVPASDITISGASAVFQVKDVALSTNTNLKSLSVSNGTLSPRFSASTTKYTVNVGKSVEKCEIYATPADSSATVTVSGSSALKFGTNTRSIMVVSPSGDYKYYTVDIIRSETDDTTSSEPEEPETNPLQITDGEFQNFTVTSDISGITLFNGFTASTANFNETEISVATDEKGEFKLYYLKAPEGEETVICTYDEETKTFKEISYIVQGNYTYILADLPDGFEIPEEYYTTNTKISDKDIKCFANTSSPDFYYLYCYTDGKYGFYRFDSRESVLQRYPELEPTKASDEVPADTTGNIFDRFNSLTTNSKIILICLAVVALAIITLIVLLIIKLVKKSKEDKEDDDLLDDFDDIAINGNFFITDSDNTQTDESEE